ncbi:hypothetical protein BC939DRAFT_445911 [Gamsiella multidivaricata]|uniref:uncharacterized protein n=1 Tax=Gamsiella multidivaricata TaxID=101098 RepID=UPI00221ECF35|nr:uncharacterized protein BC939DRAFT_445911 [Gamsiella multidivaricata]KAG0369807.1 hypothetical protein BGZ54_008802 [Gamsiella multidivaricata]KAI7827147.1 hypothetical protein BC939DRAFT_445911 [Gamsiella multidivaricata]
MSSNSDNLTLPVENEIDGLPEDEESPTQDGNNVLVSLCSLTPTAKNIDLTRNKTIVGRNAAKCTEGAVLMGDTISGTHFEITSRSMQDSKAAIWIKDTSSNGVWVNNTRIAKDEPIKIFNKDIVSFAASNGSQGKDTLSFILMDNRKRAASKGPQQDRAKRLHEEVDAQSSIQDSGPDAKKKKADADEDEANDFEKEFSCGICYEIMHNALVLQPCLHAFCKECCKIWFQRSSECPSCRQGVARTKRDFKLNNLIAVFLRARPHMKREDAEDDGADSDSSDVVKKRRGRNRHHGDDDIDIEEEDDEDDDDDDDEYDIRVIFDNNAGRDLPLHPNFAQLPPGCPCCDVDNTLGYVCPVELRLGPLPQNPTYGEYFDRRAIQPGHIQCLACTKHLPIIPQDVEEAVADKFRCKMCHIASCGCQTKSVEDYIVHSVPINGYLNNSEEKIINDYLREKNRTPASVWQEIKDGIDNGDFSYLGTTDRPAARGQDVTSASKLCLGCARDFFANGPLYQWRVAISPDELPAAVRNRENCWWGRECRTQHNFLRRGHAERLNHMCEKRRGRT